MSSHHDVLATQGEGCARCGPGWMRKFSIFVKVINLTALGKPFPMFVHCPHSEQDMGVGIMSRRIGVVDGKVNNHAFGNKLLFTKLPDKDSILVGRYLSGDGMISVSADMPSI